MADIDLKTLTPDTSLPTTGFLFGADSQASASPSVYSTQTVATTLLGSTSLTGATVTADSPVLNLAQTWNNSGVTFTGLKFNAAGSSSTNSASGSLFIDLQLGGVTKLNINKNGLVSSPGNTGGGFSANLSGGVGFEGRWGASFVVATMASSDGAGSVTVSGDGRFQFSNAALSVSSPDLFLTRRAAANLRLGAADAGATTATVTITIAAPGVVTWTSHGFSTGTPVVFTTTGALPTGITAGTTYYAVVVDANTFQIASSVANAIATPATVITTSGTQSGTHTGTRYNITQRLGMQSVTGVTDRLGADLIIQGSQGTGTGAGGSIVFQVAPAGLSGTAQNALATALTLNGDRTISFADILNGASSISVGARLFIGCDPSTQQLIGLNNGMTLRWGSGSTVAGSSTYDTILARDVPGNILALKNGANPQTFRVYNTTDGTNSEFGFAQWSSNVFQIGTGVAGTGSNRNVAIISGTRTMTFNTSGDLDVPNSVFSGGWLRVAANGRIYWASQSTMTSPSDGVIALYNAALTDFNRLQFGGTTSSFPAIKRSSTTLQARLADDSGFASVQGKLTTDTAYTAGDPTTTGYLVVYDSAGVAYKIPAVAV